MKKRITMLSQTIQDYLAARNMTQGELARRLDISDSYLSNMLSGNNRMSVERALQIAAVLQLSTEQTTELIRLAQPERDSEALLETREESPPLVVQKATHLIAGLETLQGFLREKKAGIQHTLAQFQEVIARLQEEVASLDALLSFPELRRIHQTTSAPPPDTSHGSSDL